MLARGLFGLLFFPVEGHLDFRQGKLNASSDIRDPKDERVRPHEVSFRESSRSAKELYIYKAQSSIKPGIYDIVYSIID